MGIKPKVEEKKNESIVTVPDFLKETFDEPAKPSTRNPSRVPDAPQAETKNESIVTVPDFLKDNFEPPK